MLARQWLAYRLAEPRALKRRAACFSLQRVWRGHQGRKAAFALWVKKVTRLLCEGSGLMGTHTHLFVARASAFLAPLSPPSAQTSAAMFVQRFARHLSHNRDVATGKKREAAATKLQRSW